MTFVPQPEGYLTPNTPPEDFDCRIFKIPNDTLWLANFMGALMVLLDEKSWQQFGDLTPSEASAAYLDIITDGYESERNTCDALMVDAPYWSDADNAETEAPTDSQGWYGVVTSEVWHEQLADWFLAGFLAIAASPGAAIQYLTFVPRFRLAVRTLDIGAAVKIFLDGTEIFVGDTHSDTEGIMNIDVMADTLSPDVSPHTVIIMQNSASSLQVIRKKLDPNELYPTNQRYHSATDTVQYTPDGGTTWVDAPQFDPRHSAGNLIPLKTGGADPKCNAAANMSAYIKSVIDGILGPLAAASGALGLATYLLPAFVELGPFALLFDLVVGVASVMFDAGVAALNAAFTTTVYSQLTCIFYCHIGTNGAVTAADVTAIESDIASQIGGLVSTLLDAMLSLMGEVGLSNAGASGTLTGQDCSGCFCGWTLKQLQTFGHAHITPINSYPYGGCTPSTPNYDGGQDKYVAQVVACPGYNGAMCELNIVFTNVTTVTNYRILCENNQASGPTDTRVEAYNASGGLIAILIDHTSGGGGDLSVSGTWSSVKTIRQYTRSNQSPGTMAEICYIQMQGTGTAPF